MQHLGWLKQSEYGHFPIDHCEEWMEKVKRVCNGAYLVVQLVSDGQWCIAQYKAR